MRRVTDDSCEVHYRVCQSMQSSEQEEREWAIVAARHYFTQSRRFRIQLGATAELKDVHAALLSSVNNAC